MERQRKIITKNRTAQQRDGKAGLSVTRRGKGIAMNRGAMTWNRFA